MTWLTVRLQQPADTALYRLTSGRATLSSLSRLPIAMLTTTGASTRQLPVVAMPTDNGMIVIASNDGRPNHPARYHNIVAHRQAHVSTRGIDRAVIAHELTGAERDHHFRAAVNAHPGFSQHAARAHARRIPELQLAFTRTETES